MASSKSSTPRQSGTGSYTVPVYRSAATGKLVSSKPSGRIIVKGSGSTQKAS